MTASQPNEMAATDKVPVGDQASRSPGAIKQGSAAAALDSSAGADEKLASSAQASSRPTASSQGISGAGPKLSSSSGAASIRASEGRGNAHPAGTADASGTESNGGRGVAVGNSTGLPGTQRLSKGDADFLARYAKDYQGYWLAAEGALAKEKIPPGFKQYIADYFAAIHK
jgi:hypothetical protein